MGRTRSESRDGVRLHDGVRVAGTSVGTYVGVGCVPGVTTMVGVTWPMVGEMISIVDKYGVDKVASEYILDGNTAVMSMVCSTDWEMLEMFTVVSMELIMSIDDPNEDGKTVMLALSTTVDRNDGLSVGSMVAYMSLAKLAVMLIVGSMDHMSVGMMVLRNNPDDVLLISYIDDIMISLMDGDNMSLMFTVTGMEYESVNSKVGVIISLIYMDVAIP